MLCFLLIGRKKEREKEKSRNGCGAFFPQGQTHLAGFAMQGFCGC
jgi:hypothetical protein